MLPLVAVMAVALLSMAALAIDIGFAAAQQNRLQAAADAMSMSAAHEELRLRNELRLGATLSDLGCADLEREACIETLALARGRAMRRMILGDGDVATDLTFDVDLGPGPVGDPLARCERDCWQGSVVQAVPLLFGQASMLAFSDDDSLRSLTDARDAGRALSGDGSATVGALRTRGIPIGGVARTEARPIVAAGLSVPIDPETAGAANGAGGEVGGVERAASELPGRAPFALDIEAWLGEDFERGGREILTVDGAVLSLASPSIPTTDPVVGRLLPGTTPPVVRAGSEVVIDTGATTEPLSEGERLAFVPLTFELEGRSFVVGFGLAVVEVEGAGEALRIFVTRSEERIARGNVSASPRMLDLGGIAVLSSLSSVSALPNQLTDQLAFAPAPAAPR